ncbi:MAG TPA: S8 family serine peptidase [Thermoflexales bacterium]|nr:S8 family serine peptidase [Thermoflexales bacterium]
MKRIFLALVFFAMAFAPAASAIAVQSPPEQVSPPNPKISPWVMGHTAGGQTAEFLVILNDQADLGFAKNVPANEKAAAVVSRLRQTAQASQKPILQMLKAAKAEYRAFFVVNAIWVKGDAALAQRLAVLPEVARIDGNPVIRSSIPLPDDPSTQPEKPMGADAVNAVEWNITAIGAPSVWAQGYTGQGVVVGAQDTGYSWTHPAIQGKYRGWNGITATHDYNWHDSIHVANGSCPADSPTPCDDHGHGTHTVGTATGDDGAGNQVGVAPGAKWIGCRNMNSGNGTPATYLECFEFFLAPYPVGGTPAQGNPAFAPDVTVNSWGCPPSEGCNAASLLAGAQAQRAAGIFTEASAGNSGSACGTVQDPIAIYDEVFSVGAVDSAGNIASFSSRGPVTVDGSNRPKPDISAPGVGVRSSIPGGSYASWSGTSMAGPHVAGAVALIWSAQPLLKHQIDFTEDLLRNTATPVSVTACSSSGVPNNVYGAGKLNVLAAVNATPKGSAVITGVVSSLLSGLPISGAQVMAQYVTPTLQFGAVTDASGIYSLTVLPGTYTMTASASMFISSTIGGVSAISGTQTQQNFALPGDMFIFYFPNTLKQALTPGGW